MSELNRFKEKTVVGIVTCNRQDYFNECIASIDRDAVKQIFVVNSGRKYDSYPDDAIVHQCTRDGTVVGVAKNILLREMRNAFPDAEFFFVAEDDIKIRDNKVFEKYIETGLDSGLIHGQLSYALHGGIGGGNVGEDGFPHKKSTLQYTKHKIDVYKHSLAAFTFYHASTFKNFGTNLFDERYINAAEHLSLHQKLHKVGYGTPFWNFCDIYNSQDYIIDQDINHVKSSIRSHPEFIKNFNYSYGLFKSIHGKSPNQISDVSPTTLLGCLEQLEQLYSDKSRI